MIPGLCSSIPYNHAALRCEMSAGARADNSAAIHAYERIGFRRVGVMRQYERGADGTFHDGVLMELLQQDYRPLRP